MYIIEAELSMWRVPVNMLSHWRWIIKVYTKPIGFNIFCWMGAFFRVSSGFRNNDLAYIFWSHFISTWNMPSIWHTSAWLFSRSSVKTKYLLVLNGFNKANHVWASSACTVMNLITKHWQSFRRNGFIIVDYGIYWNIDLEEFWNKKIYWTCRRVILRNLQSSFIDQDGMIYFDVKATYTYQTFTLLQQR